MLLICLFKLNRDNNLYAIFILCFQYKDIFSLIFEYHHWTSHSCRKFANNVKIHSFMNIAKSVCKETSIYTKVNMVIANHL